MAKYTFGKKVILRRKIENPVDGLNYDFRTETSVHGEKLEFKWNKANGYTVEVPTKIEYYDADIKATKLAWENYAQSLLNNYKGVFEVVGEVPESLVKQPTVQLSEVEQLKAKLKEEEKKNLELKAKLAVPEEPKEPPKKEHWKTKQKREKEGLT